MAVDLCLQHGLKADTFGATQHTFSLVKKLSKESKFARHVRSQCVGVEEQLNAATGSTSAALHTLNAWSQIPLFRFPVFPHYLSLLMTTF